MSDSQTNHGPDGVSRRNMLALSGGSAAVLAGAAAVAMAARPAKAQTSAGGKLQQVLERGHLIVGTGSTNPPWHFEDQDGKLIGMDIDMARLLAKALFEDPEKVEFVLQAADARIPNLVTDKVDICIQFMTVTGGRAQQVDFTIPYYREGVSLLLRVDSPYADYAAMKAAGSAVRVSALQNVFIEDWIRLALPEAQIDQYESVDAGIQALNAGRADAYVNDQSATAWLVRQFPDRYRDGGYGWMPNSYAAAVRQGDQTWLNYVNTVFHEAMTGVDFLSYQASFKQWFGQEIPPPKVGFPIEFQ